ncbi:hypothetical protein F968_02475 [Acinetobacter sp. NIPH 817]|nr:hypothetical protein F968_02475 [Acinetobacter sp. NIPH 817]
MSEEVIEKILVITLLVSYALGLALIPLTSRPKKKSKKDK